VQFKNIPGNEQVKAHLIQTVRENRISHSQLFLGPEGSASLALALAYVQYVNCSKRTESDSCGNCPSCIKIGKLIHPDLHFTYPTISPHKQSRELMEEWKEAILKNPYLNVFSWLQELKAENKQGNITAEESRDVIRRLGLKSYEAEYKMQIIWMPEYLGHEGNMLLKLFEEPPEKTLIILVANDSEKILATILSRMQIVRVNRFTDEEVKAFLVAGFGLDEARAATIARLSEGNLNEAIIHTGGDEEDLLQHFKSWMNLCIVNKPADLVSWIEEAAGMGRENLKNFLRYGLHMVREAFIKRKKIEPLSRVNADESEFVGKFSTFIHEQNLEAINQEFTLAIGHIERNANPKIILMNLSLFLRGNLRKPEPVA
jgi:DNA polymerase III subunit delta'